VLALFDVRLRALALSIVLVVFALPAFAGPFEDAISKFANDDFSDTDEAVGEVATSGHPQAFAIISALQDGRLMADPETKRVYVTQPDGKAIDAATGAAVDKLPDSVDAVRLNNRLRRTVEAALGGLTLLSPDPAKRVEAAQSVFKTHDAAMLPVIDGALAKETNKAAKLAFTEARAAILLFKEDATDAEKIEAIRRNEIYNQATAATIQRSEKASSVGAAVRKPWDWIKAVGDKLK
jgi:urea transport system permease protein